jgi:hypothetical protein
MERNFTQRHGSQQQILPLLKKSTQLTDFFTFKTPLHLASPHIPESDGLIITLISLLPLGCTKVCVTMQKAHCLWKCMVEQDVASGQVAP